MLRIKPVLLLIFVSLTLVSFQTANLCPGVTYTTFDNGFNHYEVYFTNHTYLMIFDTSEARTTFCLDIKEDVNDFRLLSNGEKVYITSKGYYILFVDNLFEAVGYSDVEYTHFDVLPGEFGGYVLSFIAGNKLVMQVFDINTYEFLYEIPNAQQHKQTDILVNLGDRAIMYENGIKQWQIKLSDRASSMFTPYLIHRFFYVPTVFNHAS